MPTRWAALGLVAVGLCQAWPAHAVLGEPVASVHVDQMRLHGARRQSLGLRYQVHDITQADGSVLRQFATPSGVVFAVSWRSHLKPNLSSLLGVHYENYARATRAAAPGRGFTRRNAIQAGDLVVTESQHLGFFSGQAFVRHLVPEGVDVNGLR